jgi:hypothetical protein
MLKSISRIAALTVGIGIALAGGPARAESLNARVMAEMNRGKDYITAWQEAVRAIGPGYSPELAGAAKKVERKLNEGMDYFAAWDNFWSPDEITRVRREQSVLAKVRCAGSDRITCPSPDLQ